MKFNIIAFATALFFIGYQSVYAQTAEEILKKYYKAVGGEANWKKINTMKQTFVMTSSGGEVHGTRQVLHNKGSRRDLNISFSGRNMVTTMVVTTKTGWIHNSFAAKTTTMSEDKVKGSQGELDLHDPLRNFVTGGKMAYVGKDTADGKSCFKVRNTTGKGDTCFLYFDATTYFLLRVNVREKQGEKMVSSITDLMNYTPQKEGVVYAMKMIINAPENQGLLTIMTDKLELNEPVDEKLFVPPLN